MKTSVISFWLSFAVFGHLICAQDGTPVDTTSSTVSVLQEVVTPEPSQTLLPFETLQLTDGLLEGLNETELELFAFEDTDTTESAASRLARRTFACKVFPGDLFWPLEIVWKLFDLVLGGALLKPVPKASVCWGSTYNQAACAALTASWTDSYSHQDDPIEMYNPEFQGMTCQPPSNQYSYITTCTQGGYPVYTVEARNVAQIQLAVNFARATGVRLVIKNTGHDFLGKSSGAGSLSIWTHYLKDTLYIPNYVDASGYKGPAIKAGSGVQAFELYKFAKSKGVAVVAGEGQTVGVMGGYILGGGHSPLSSIYGMAADQVLGFEIVTPDGRFRRATSNENSDLFWALRGGGGGTYGIVTSVIVKAYPDITCTTASFTFAQGGDVTADKFWAGVNSYFKRFPQYTSAGTYGYWFIYPNFMTGVGNMFIMQPFFLPKMNTAQAQELLKPWLAELASLGINVTPTYNTYSSFYDAWQAGFPLETIMNAKAVTASRLIPADNWSTPAKLNATTAVLRSFAEAGHFLVAFHIAPKLIASNTQNAVNPAWRNALAHIIVINSWGETSRANAKASWDRFSFTEMQKWRDVTPGSGSYLGEADRQEPNWQQSFYGSNYAKLKSIKEKYDPHQLLWAATAVGSEGWSVRTSDGLAHENGRLCRT